MAQKQYATQDAVERLKEAIAKDRSRLSSALQLAEVEASERPSVGRLYRVFAAMGEAS
jgi:hypothetical protein